MRIFPCKDCKDRVLGCWSTCEKYKKAKADYDKKKEAERRKHIYNGHFYG